MTKAFSNLPQIGYGTAGLGSLNSESEILALMECAYENGIRHFDTAASYGYGTMEAVCGKFAKNKRAEITITSKFGQPVLSHSVAKAGGLRAIRKLVRHVKPLYDLGRKLVKRATPPRERLGKIQFQAAVELSLQKSGLEYFDFYMIHERDIDEIDFDEISEEMQRVQQDGKIRHLGISVTKQQLNGYLGRIPDSWIIQTECGLLGGGSPSVTSPCIYQRIFQVDEESRAKYHELAKSHGEEQIRKWQIAYAVQNSNNGICLFGSLSKKHIKWNSEIHRQIFEQADVINQEIRALNLL